MDVIVIHDDDHVWCTHLFIVRETHAIMWRQMRVGMALTPKHTHTHGDTAHLNREACCNNKTKRGASEGCVVEHQRYS